jgi:uncharacterized protein (DUF885 family)
MSPSEVFEFADQVVREGAAHHPVAATYRGLPGHDAELTDFSAEQAAATIADVRARIAALDDLRIGNDDDRLAIEVMRERLGAETASYDTGEHLRDVNVLFSPVQITRNVFTLMPTENDEQWETIATRLEKVPHALGTMRASYAEGMARGVLPARRQVLGAATSAAVAAGLEAEGDGAPAPFFDGFVEGYTGADASLASRLRSAAEAATVAYADAARWMRDDYAPHALEQDGVGRERYAGHARNYLGADVDLDETYAWGWADLTQITRRMHECAAQLYGGSTPAQAQERLNGDPAYTHPDAESTRAWLQQVTDETTQSFNGRYFDIPERMLTCEAMIAPPGSAAAPFYTAPSEDFSRPGRTWLPAIDTSAFRDWWLLSVWHHEAVPGHHLQVAYAMCQSEHLSRFQRTTMVSGHAEGWALYSERLMDELGYYEDPAYALGFLSNQAMRATRVVLDIGLHLGLPIPVDVDPLLVDGVEGDPRGIGWTPDIARQFLAARALQSDSFARSEVDRYLGLPGQAISYKVGERLWVAARERAQAAGGSSFDLKAWHMKALSLGSVGLAVLDSELARG